MSYISNSNFLKNSNKSNEINKFNVNYTMKSKFFRPESEKNKKEETIFKIKRLLSNFNEITLLDDFSLIVMIKRVIKKCCVQKFENFI